MLFDLKKREDKYLLFIASFLFLIWAIDTLGKLIFSTYVSAFWFCTLSILIVVLLILLRNPSLLLGFLSVSIVIQGIWLVDILALVFLGKDIFGTSYYLFVPGISNMEVFTTMRHFFLIPLEIFAFIFMKRLPKNFFNIFLAILIVTSAFLGVSLLFGSQENVNYIYGLTFNPGLTFSNYPLFFFTYLSFIVISGTIVAYVLYRLVKRYKRVFELKHIQIYFWIVFVLCFALALKVSLFVFNVRKTMGFV